MRGHAVGVLYRNEIEERVWRTKTFSWGGGLLAIKEQEKAN